MRVCKSCKAEKPLSCFAQVKGRYWRRTCHTCRTYATRDLDPAAYRERRSTQAREQRQRQPHVAIVQDARSWDRKHGFPVPDLDAAFVQTLLRFGCSYCHADDLRITLDRVNNALGHVRSNVVAACIRCNLLRGSMPYSAWMNLVPHVRQTRELGLFGDWNSRPLNKRKLDASE